ncbi:uncharacterized protein LOC144148327 [Haemaphysalis longicornis]
MVASAAAAEKMNVVGEDTILGQTCQVTCVGPQVVYMTALRLKLFIRNDDLAAALAPYGRIDNGTRSIKMEMRKPMPNFIFVRECKVQIEYRGVKRVYSRCGQSGHNWGDCQAPWCDRCQAFGHDATSCTAVCRKCGGKHATVDCLNPRTCVAALDEFPALLSGATEQPHASGDRENEVEGSETDTPSPWMRFLGRCPRSGRVTTSRRAAWSTQTSRRQPRSRHRPASHFVTRIRHSPFQRKDARSPPA